MQSRQLVSLARRWRISSTALGLAIFFPTHASVVHAQLDICGCTGNSASLGDFDTANLTTAQQQVITSNAQQKLEIQLPPDGVLVFNSLNLRPRTTPINDFGSLTITFTRNAANTPVTLLVSGNVTIASGVTLQLGGENAVSGSTATLGGGGLGGPGGFRGGDGAYQLGNFATNGGAGLGPGGGAGGTNNQNVGGNGGSGTFLGATDLLPLVGGSGGGGGASTSNASGCAAGGGGGGGGALLIAANGTFT